jgi:hypothetical protein
VADDPTANHGADAEQSPRAQFAPDVARLVEVGLRVRLAIAASSTSDQRRNVVVAEPADLDYFVAAPRHREEATRLRRRPTGSAGRAVSAQIALMVV